MMDKDKTSFNTQSMIKLSESNLQLNEKPSINEPKYQNISKVNTKMDLIEKNLIFNCISNKALLSIKY